MIDHISHMNQTITTNQLGNGSIGFVLQGTPKIKNIDQYLDFFLLSFFLKDNQGGTNVSPMQMFSEYLTDLGKLNVSNFLDSIERVSTDILDLIRDELCLILKDKQDDKIREKIYALDLHTQISTDLYETWNASKAVSKIQSKTSLASYDLISDKGFVGRLFLLALQNEIANPTLVSQVEDAFSFTIRDIAIKCQKQMETKYMGYLKQVDACFERQINDDTVLFAPLDKTTSLNGLSTELNLMLFFLIGHTLLLVLDIMLKNSTILGGKAVLTSNDESEEAPPTNVVTQISRGVLLLSVVGAVVWLVRE